MATFTVAGSLSAEEKAALMPPPAAPVQDRYESLMCIAVSMAQDLQEYADAADEADPGSGQATRALIDEFEQVRTRCA